MTPYDEPDNRSGSYVLMIALVAFLVVVLVVCGGTLWLYRVGAFDALIPAQPRVHVPEEVPGLPAVTPQRERPPLIVTATPGIAIATPGPGLLPTHPVTPTVTPSPTPTPEPTPTPSPTPELAGRYRVEYVGCTPHDSDIGTVKGQVFDRDGQVIIGAEVRITLDDWVYDVTSHSNAAGWYEFYLSTGPDVRIHSLVIRGEEMLLVGQEQAFPSRGGCFQQVNLREE